MKVKDLMQFLAEVDPEAEVIISKDFDDVFFAMLEKTVEGVFKKTDYGNDFFPNESLIANEDNESRAICLIPESKIVFTTKPKQKKEDMT